MSRVLALKTFASERKIVLGLAAASVVALAMTTLSIWMYNISDVSRLDVSRPGYEQARESVIKADDALSFSASGELDVDAMKDFQQLFDAKRKALNAMGGFEGTILEDSKIIITAPLTQ